MGGAGVPCASLLRNTRSSKRRRGSRRVDIDQQSADISDLDIDDDFFIGFQSTASTALSLLDERGYTHEFFSAIYSIFRPTLDAWLPGILQQSDPRSTNASPTTDAHPDDDLDVFVSTLREWTSNDFTDEFFSKPLLPREGETRIVDPEAGILETVDARYYFGCTTYDRRGWTFDHIRTYLLHRARDTPPAIVRVLTLYGSEFLTDYPELVTVLMARLCLEICDQDAEVLFDITEVAYDFEPLDLLARGQRVLDEKIALYSEVFRVLSQHQHDAQQQVSRAKVRSVLSEPEEADPNVKGLVLEDAMTSLFASVPGLRVIETRVNTRDEEIDLVVANDVDRPLWVQLQSPLIFVECKNWTSTVGASQLRDFEVKVQNHPLARFGILIAPGGFSRETSDALKRSSRGHHRIILVDATALEAFVKGADPREWLETQLLAVT